MDRWVSKLDTAEEGHWWVGRLFLWKLPTMKQRHKEMENILIWETLRIKWKYPKNF